MATLFRAHSKGSRHEQCELSLRNKVDAGVAAGEILALQPKKQPHGNVGRPKSVFVLKANYDKATMTLVDAKAKTPKTRKAKTTPATVAVAPATPAAAPVAPAPVTAAPASVSDTPAPAPATAPEAPVSTAPVAAPATPEPATGS